jgi:hypothetical protein
MTRHLATTSRMDLALDHMATAIDELVAELAETDRARDRIQAEADRLARLSDEETAHARR